MSSSVHSLKIFAARTTCSSGRKAFRRSSSFASSSGNRANDQSSPANAGDAIIDIKKSTIDRTDSLLTSHPASRRIRAGLFGMVAPTGSLSTPRRPSRPRAWTDGDPRIRWSFAEVRRGIAATP